MWEDKIKRLRYRLKIEQARPSLNAQHVMLWIKEIEARGGVRLRRK